MTINIADNNPRVSYSVSAGVTQTSFAVPFEFFDETDVLVYIDSTLKTITTDYTVSGGDGTTGTITMSVTGPATVALVRDVTIERSTDFPTAGPFSIQSLNVELDKQIAIDADLEDQINRAVRSPIEEFTTMTLPDAATRADKILKFDTAGNVAVETAAALVGGSVLGANFTNNTFTGDGSQTVFTTTVEAGSKNNAQVYIDGVYQLKSSFSVSGLTLTFTEAPPVNSQIEVIIGNAIANLDGDSGNVNYNQGSTGAQTRTVENKLQEFISVKDFGAIGNAVTDDTTALDNALTAARSANKPLYFPAGTYKRTTALQIEDNDKFIGDGRKESIIRFVPPSVITACVVPADDTNFTDFCLFENISLTGDPSTPTNTPIGIWGKSLRTSRFSQMEFNYFSQNCVYLYGQRTAVGGLNPGDSTYNYFEQCRFLSGQDAVRLGGTAGTARIDSGTSNINTFNKCRFNSATRYGLWMERGANNVFTACSVVSNPNDSGIRVSWYANSFIGCVAENNGAYGIRFDNESETHDNWVFGLHDGGSNVSGLFQDQNNQNYWFATNKGVHLGYESGGSADNYSMYSKSDGNLYWKNSSGTEIKVSNDANKQTVTGSTGGNAALQNLLSALDTMGIITDSTT